MLRMQGGPVRVPRKGRRVLPLLRRHGNLVRGRRPGRITIGPPAHSRRTKEELAAHGRWLVEQHDEFLRRRDRLKDDVKPYLGGDFV